MIGNCISILRPNSFEYMIKNESIKQVSIATSSDNAEEQKVQDLLLKILTAGLQESRYAVFEQTIRTYEENCFNKVYKLIAESEHQNKEDQLKKLQELYENHIKDYPKQNRQAILEGQIPKPIARNAGIAVNALCNQMHGFTF